VIFYKNLLVILGLSLAGFMLVFIVVSFVSFSPAPLARNPMEAPSEDQISLLKRNTIVATNLKNPLTPARPVLKGFPPEPLEEIANAHPQKDSILTMTLIQDGKKMALIDGQVVKEGDVVNQLKVVKIERDKGTFKNR
jgi:hypothetical protein